MGAITAEERAMVRGRSPVGAKYETAVNRESAYELLTKRAATGAAERGEAESPASSRSRRDQAPQAPGSNPLGDMLWGTKRRQGMVEAMAKQAARTVGSQVGRQILRGVLGGILGGSRRR
jgi:hypothetical protein